VLRLLSEGTKMSNLVLLPVLQADLSAVVASTTVPFDATYSKVLCAQAVWTSTTLSGSLALQFSLDNTNWTDFVTATSITNTSSSVFWNIFSTATAATVGVDAPYWRVSVVRSSGTYTTLKVYFGSQSR
jgi:hypothetical protein